MITITHKGNTIKISDIDYNQIYIDCEGACHHCMLDGGCSLQRKLETKIKRATN